MGVQFKLRASRRACNIMARPSPPCSYCWLTRASQWQWRRSSLFPPSALGGLGRSWRVVLLPECSSMARAAPSAALPPPRLCGMAAPGRDSATWGGGTPPGALVPTSTGAAAFLGRSQAGALAGLRNCGCGVREHDMLLRLFPMRIKFLPVRVCPRAGFFIRFCRASWAGAWAWGQGIFLRPSASFFNRLC